MFASHLAEHRLHYGWETWVIRGQADPVVDAAAIDGVVAPRLTDPAVDIVSIVLPAIEQSTQLEAILIALALNPAWQLHEQDVEDDSELGSVRPLGLTVALEFDHCSEVLGFGPGAPLAYTRRAPFTELAIRAKAPAQRRPDRRSNMADIDIDLDVTPDSLAGFYHETKRQRRARLGDEHDRRGKARVTTVVPITKGDLDQ
jgi:hypothetical protein